MFLFHLLEGVSTMSLRTWPSFLRLFSHPVRKDRRGGLRSADPRRCQRPEVERLEDRTVPTTTIGLNFTGLNLNDSGFIPPDTMGAVSQYFFVEFINGAFAIYDKTTGALVGSKITDSTFWTSKVGLPSSLVSPGLTDPRILYDPASQRWFALEINKLATGNQVLLGVTSNYYPDGSWRGLYFTADNSFGDFPTLGLDADGVYIGTNNYDSSGHFSSVSLFSIPKADLTASTPTLARMSSFKDMSSVPFGFSLQGVTNFGPSTGHGTIIAVDNNAFGTIDRYTVNNPGGAGATLSAPTQITVTSTSFPPFAGQPDGTHMLDTGDDRISASVYQVGNLLYMAHAIGVNNRSAVRWTILNETTNAVVTEGTISDPNFDFFYPSIAANAAGTVVIGYNRSGTGPGNFISSYASVGTLVGSTLTLDAPILLKAGTANYHLVDSSGSTRWGDYSAVRVDPSDPTKFWTIQEFVQSNNVWATQITRLDWSPPTAANYTAPVGGPNQIEVRQNFNNLEILNNGILVATQALASISAITVNGAANTDDTVTISYYGQLPVTVDGGSGTGTNKLIGPYLVTSTWNLTGTNSGNIHGNGVYTFSNFQNLQSRAGDTFKFANGAVITGTLRGNGTLDYSQYTTPVSVNMKTGAATGVGNGNPGGIMALDGGFTNFIGGSGANTLTGPDGWLTWTLSGRDSGQITDGAGDGWDWSFSSFGNLQAGSFGDVFLLTDGVVISGTLNGGPGSDTLSGTTSTTTWDVTGGNAGTLNGIPFSSFENLQGGGGNDTFKIEPTGSLGGAVNGGAGGNWLDYSAWVTSVVVNLGTGAATAISGTTSNIQNVIGGSANDTLTGGAAGGILLGSAGNDTLTGGSGRSILIGGLGADTITGGSNEDILIGGTTSFDTNQSVLLSLLAEWQRTDETYQQRITNLKTGTGGLNGNNHLLFGTTVFDDSSINTLTGGAGLDWFFKGAFDTITDFMTGETIN
jgi:hypothetical protein